LGQHLVAQIKQLISIMDTDMVCGAALNVVEQLEERWHKAEQGHGQNLDIQKERYQLLSFAAC